MQFVQQLNIDWQSLVPAVGSLIAAGVWFAWYAKTKNQGHLFWGGVFLLLAAHFGFSYQYRPPDIVFERSAAPALKLEVRRASTEKIDGWEADTTPDAQEDEGYYVSPKAELTNDDVAGTRVHFEPYGPKPPSRWRSGAYALFFSVVLFVVWWRDKRWWWGVGGAALLLLGLAALWQGFTSTSPRFDPPRGNWQVVIRFNDAGTKKVADLTASMMEGRTEQTRSYPKNHLAFLVDGELTFVAPVWAQNTEGVYYLLRAHAMDPAWNREGILKEDATRIARGIVSP